MARIIRIMLFAAVVLMVVLAATAGVAFADTQGPGVTGAML